MHEVFRVVRLCYGRAKGMGSRATEKMRSEMMQGSGERTEGCQGLGMEEGQQQRFMGRQVAARGNCRGLSYFGPKTMEALQQVQMVHGVLSTVIASEEEEVRMIVQKEGKLFDVNYPRSFTNLLGPYNGLNIVGHMWKCMRHFIVANVLKPELL
ncbi:unnamed protein product [Sphagnum tenellum]